MSAVVRGCRKGAAGRQEQERKRLGFSLLLLQALVFLAVLGALPNVSSGEAQAPRSAWTERFDGHLDWIDPFDHDPAELARVYSLKRESGVTFLKARHDASVSSPPPAMHFGHAFQPAPVPLEKVKSLSWKWRARKHPNVTDNAWEDMSAGIYVLIKTPSLFSGGKGFKFGWLAKPGPEGTRQRGLIQIALRDGAPAADWITESVDLCALFRRHYGACEGEKVLYIGVVTDADGTRSIAEADYTDFELTLR